MSGLVCPVLTFKLISIGRQPVLIAARRCYLIQMLRSALACINGCSCWSPDEENSPRIFPYHGCALPTELGGASSVSAVRNQYCGCDADKGTCTSGTHSQTASLMIPDRRGIGSANGRLISSPCVVPAYTQEPRPCSCPRRRENHGLHRGGCTSSHNAVRSHTRQHQPSGDVQPTVLSVPAPPCQALVSVRPLACQERRFSHLLNSTDTTERDAGMLLLLRPPPAPPG
jgi:hypothetical protein